MVVPAEVEESGDCTSNGSRKFRRSSASLQSAVLLEKQPHEQAAYNFANTPLNAAQVPLATANTIHALRLSIFIFAASHSVVFALIEEYEGGEAPSSGRSAPTASSLIGRMAAVRLASWWSWEVAESSGATRRRSIVVERGEDMSSARWARLGDAGPLRALLPLGCVSGYVHAMAPGDVSGGVCDFVARLAGFDLREEVYLRQ